MTYVLKTDLTEIVSRLGEEAKQFAGKTVILTGGRGFLGRYFLNVFAALNANVLEAPVRLIVLDNLIEQPHNPSVMLIAKIIYFLS